MALALTMFTILACKIRFAQTLVAIVKFLAQAIIQAGIGHTL